ncbi:TPA: glycosyltransferase [Klebsiella pneumoniae]|nr:glycosyltransferase [Klebsiella pneumoniae]
MKVRFVIQGFDGGGGPQSTLDISDAIKIHGIESDIYSFKEFSNGLSNTKVFKALYCLWCYLYGTSKYEKECIFINSGGILIGAFLALYIYILRFFFRRKIIYLNIFHNRIKSDNDSFLINYLRYILSFFSLSAAQKAICVSEGLRCEIHEDFRLFGCVKNKLITIYNPKRDFPPRSISNTEDKKNVKRILSVGRLCKQKSFETLLNAYKLLILDHDIPDTNLVIVGEGDELFDLKKMTTQLSIEDNVSFLGFTKHIEKEYYNSDVFVLPSIHEGFGLVLVEALSCGLPVISTNCRYGPSEILGDGKYGELVPIQDHEAMYKAIKNILILNEHDLSLKINEGLIRANEFNKPTIGAKYSTVLNELVEHN